MSHPPPTSAEYTGYKLKIVAAVIIPLQIGAVALRFYARSLTAAKYGADDAIVLASLVAQIISAGVGIASVEHAGVGYHVGYLEATNPELVVTFLKYLVFIAIWYFATVNWSKIAILMLYKKIFPKKSAGVVVWVTGLALVGSAIGTVVANLAACRPFSSNWGTLEEQQANCINKETLFVWGTLPNILTDVVMLGLPIPIVWRLHTSTKLKLALTVTFLFGGVGVVASIVRFIVFSNTNSFTDSTFAAVELITWTMVEPMVYLISACMLTYRPLAEKFRLKSVGGYSHNTRNTRNTRNTHNRLHSMESDGQALRSSSKGQVSDVSDLELQVGGGTTTTKAAAHGRGYEQTPWKSMPRSTTSPRSIAVTTTINQSWDQNRT